MARAYFGHFLSATTCYWMLPGIPILNGLTQGRAWYLHQITEFGGTMGVQFYRSGPGWTPPFTLESFFFTKGTEPPGP